MRHWYRVWTPRGPRPCWGNMMQQSVKSLGRRFWTILATRDSKRMSSIWLLDFRMAAHSYALTKWRLIKNHLGKLSPLFPYLKNRYSRRLNLRSLSRMRKKMSPMKAMTLMKHSRREWDALKVKRKNHLKKRLLSRLNRSVEGSQCSRPNPKSFKRRFLTRARTF